MNVAVMQPYLFPYLGYFNLVHACDTFVFLDNVQHIARGFVNRNRILLNGEAHTFTAPLGAAPRDRWINERRTGPDFPRFKEKFLAQLRHAYKGAPCFDEVMTLVENVLGSGGNLALMCRGAVRAVSHHLGLERRFLTASDLMDESEARVLKGPDKIIALARQAGGTRYLNAMGGMDLYATGDFADAGLELAFVKPALPPYIQRGSRSFVPGLSVIDFIMNVPADEAGELLCAYEILAGVEAQRIGTDRRERVIDAS